MLQELISAIGLESACLIYGLDIRVITNVTVKS